MPTKSERTFNIDLQKDLSVHAPEITRETIAAFLADRGWVNERPGRLFAWKDPKSALGGYSLFGALQHQLVYDAEPRSANAGPPQPTNETREERQKKKEEQVR
jgi:hypothetical protein